MPGWPVRGSGAAPTGGRRWAVRLGGPSGRSRGPDAPKDPHESGPVLHAGTHFPARPARRAPRPADRAPGLESEMALEPDYGESTYRGSGRQEARELSSPVVIPGFGRAGRWRTPGGGRRADLQPVRHLDAADPGDHAGGTRQGSRVPGLPGVQLDHRRARRCHRGNADALTCAAGGRNGELWAAQWLRVPRRDSSDDGTNRSASSPVARE
jgi:hypothetical protein